MRFFAPDTSNHIRFHRSFPQVAVIIVVMILVALTSACQKAEEEKSQQESKTITGPRVLKITDDVIKRLELKTEVIQNKPVAVPLHLTGRVEPDVQKEVDISTRLSGMVTEILVKPGEIVNKGTVLALIDSREISDLQSQLLEGRSKLRIAELHEDRERQIYEEQVRRPTQLIKARALYNEAKVQKELAESEYKRLSGLFKEKIAATKDYVAAKANLAKAQVNYEESQANFKREEHLYKNRAMLKRDYQLAQAEAERAKNHVKMLTQRLQFLGSDKALMDKVVETGQISGTVRVIAPIGGIVSYRDVAVGEQIKPDRLIFTISDMSTVLLRVDLPEVDLGKVRLGDKVKIQLASYPGEVFQGTVSYISVRVNPTTRTVAVRARLNNKKGLLKKFMFAEIELEGAAETVLACPNDAIQENNDEKIVFVKTPEGFEERRVKIGFEGEKYCQVLAGLHEGEVVATQGSLMLKTEISHLH